MEFDNIYKILTIKKKKKKIRNEILSQYWLLKN